MADTLSPATTAGTGAGGSQPDIRVFTSLDSLGRHDPTTGAVDVTRYAHDPAPPQDPASPPDPARSQDSAQLRGLAAQPLTVIQLQTLAAQLAAQANTEAADTATPDLQWCLSLMQRFATHLYGTGPHGGIKTRVSRDDLHIGRSWAGAFAAERTNWTRLDSWRDLHNTLTPGQVAFVLLSRPGTREGHAAAVYGTQDAGNQWVDITGTTQRLITLLNQRAGLDTLEAPITAHAIIIDTHGYVVHDALQQTPESTSIARAITDAPTNRTYKGNGADTDDDETSAPAVSTGQVASTSAALPANAEASTSTAAADDLVLHIDVPGSFVVDAPGAAGHAAADSPDAVMEESSPALEPAIAAHQPRFDGTESVGIDVSWMWNSLPRMPWSGQPESSTSDVPVQPGPPNEGSSWWYETGSWMWNSLPRMSWSRPAELSTSDEATRPEQEGAGDTPPPVDEQRPYSAKPASTPEPDRTESARQAKVDADDDTEHERRQAERAPPMVEQAEREDWEARAERQVQQRQHVENAAKESVRNAEGEANRHADDEAKRKADETEATRQADDAEVTRKAAETERAKQKAEEETAKQSVKDDDDPPASEAKPKVKADGARPPWWAEYGMKGDSYIYRVENSKAPNVDLMMAQVAARLNALLGPNDLTAALTAVQRQLTQTLAVDDPMAWARLLRSSTIVEVGHGHWVEIQFGTDATGPELDLGRPPDSEPELIVSTSRYADTSAKQFVATETEKGVGLVLGDMSTAVRDHLDLVAGGFTPHAGVVTANKVGEAREIQSGNRTIAGNPSNFRAPLVVQARVDSGTSFNLDRSDEFFVVRYPEAFVQTATSKKPIAPKDLVDNVQSPTIVHEVNMTLNAIDVTPLIDQFETFVDSLTWSPKWNLLKSNQPLAKAKLKNNLRLEFLHEKAFKDKNRGLISGTMVSDAFTLPDGSGAVMLLTATLKAAHELAKAGGTRIRDDIAATLTTEVGRGGGSSVGAEVSTFFVAGELVSPHGGVGGSSSRLHTQSVKIQDQAKTAFMSNADEGQVRYQAVWEINAVILSTKHSFAPLTARALSEVAVATAHNERFAAALRKGGGRATSESPGAAPTKPAVLVHANQVMPNELATDGRLLRRLGSVKRSLMSAATAVATNALTFPDLPPVPEDSGETWSVLIAYAHRYGSIDVFVPTQLADADREWAARAQLRRIGGITVVTGDPAVARVPVPSLNRVRVVLDADGAMSYVTYLNERQHLYGEGYSLAQPIDTSTKAKAPIDTPRPSTMLTQFPGPQPRPFPGDSADWSTEPPELARNIGLGPGRVREIPGAVNVFPRVLAVLTNLAHNWGVGDALISQGLDKFYRDLFVRYSVPGLTSRYPDLRAGGVDYVVELTDHAGRPVSIDIVVTAEHRARGQGQPRDEPESQSKAAGKARATAPDDPSIERNISIDAQNKAGRSFDVGERRTRWVGPDFGIGFHQVIQDSWLLNFLTMSGKYRYSWLRGGSTSTGSKTYSRERLNGDARRHEYQTVYHISAVVKRSGVIVATPQILPLQGPGFWTPVLVPPQYAAGQAPPPEAGTRVAGADGVGTVRELLVQATPTPADNSVVGNVVESRAISVRAEQSGSARTDDLEMVRMGASKAAPPRSGNTSDRDPLLAILDAESRGSLPHKEWKLRSGALSGLVAYLSSAEYLAALAGTAVREHAGDGPVLHRGDIPIQIRNSLQTTVLPSSFAELVSKGGLVISLPTEDGYHRAVRVRLRLFNATNDGRRDAATEDYAEIDGRYSVTTQHSHTLGTQIDPFSFGASFGEKLPVIAEAQEDAGADNSDNDVSDAGGRGESEDYGAPGHSESDDEHRPLLRRQAPDTTPALTGQEKSLPRNRVSAAPFAFSSQYRWGAKEAQTDGNLIMNIVHYDQPGHRARADAVYQIESYRWQGDEIPSTNRKYLWVSGGAVVAAAHTPAVVHDFPQARSYIGEALVPVEADGSKATYYVNRVAALGLSTAIDVDAPRVVPVIKELLARLDVIPHGDLPPLGERNAAAEVARQLDLWERPDDIVQGITAKFGEIGLRRQAQALNGGAITHVIALPPNPLGLVRRIGIRVTAGWGRELYRRWRPDATSTTGGQSFDIHGESEHHDGNVVFRPRGSLRFVHGKNNAGRAGFIVGGEAEWLWGGAEGETKTARDIRRATHDKDTMEEMVHQLTFNVEIFQVTERMEALQGLPDAAFRFNTTPVATNRDVIGGDRPLTGHITVLVPKFMVREQDAATYVPVEEKNTSPAATTVHARQTVATPQPDASARWLTRAMWSASHVTGIHNEQPVKPVPNGLSARLADHVLLVAAPTARNVALWAANATLSEPQTNLATLPRLHPARTDGDMLAAALSNTNLRANSGPILRHEMPVTFISESKLLQGFDVARAKPIAMAENDGSMLNFPELAIEPEQEKLSGFKWNGEFVPRSNLPFHSSIEETAGSLHKRADDPASKHMILRSDTFGLGGAGEYAQGAERAAASSSGDYIETNKEYKGRFYVYEFEGDFVTYGPHVEVHQAGKVYGLIHERTAATIAVEFKEFGDPDPKVNDNVPVRAIPTAKEDENSRHEKSKGESSKGESSKGKSKVGASAQPRRLPALDLLKTTLAEHAHIIEDVRLRGDVPALPISGEEGIAVWALASRYADGEDPNDVAFHEALSVIVSSVRVLAGSAVAAHDRAAFIEAGRALLDVGRALAQQWGELSSDDGTDLVRTAAPSMVLPLVPHGQPVSLHEYDGLSQIQAVTVAWTPPIVESGQVNEAGLITSSWAAARSADAAAYARLLPRDANIVVRFDHSGPEVTAFAQSVARRGPITLSRSDNPGDGWLAHVMELGSGRLDTRAGPEPERIIRLTRQARALDLDFLLLEVLSELIRLGVNAQVTPDVVVDTMRQIIDSGVVLQTNTRDRAMKIAAWLNEPG